MNFKMTLCAILLTSSTIAHVHTANADESSVEKPLNNQGQTITRTWSFSEFSTPLYAHAPAALPYVNPSAPKGGKLQLSAFGTFDTFNFHVAKGDWPNSIGLLYDSLMEGTDDEIDAYYGVLAEYVEYPEDISWATFTLREEARYHDGSAVTAEDFVYSLNAKKEHARAMIKTAYENIEKAEALDKRRVKFFFKTKGSLKPLKVVAGMSPLPVSYWKDRDISKASLEPPLTSGPYRIKKMEPGRFIVYERVKDYWAANLPLKKGLHNFAQIQYDYYRDETVEFEAFKAGKIDVQIESSAKRWMKSYDFPAVKEGRILLKEIPLEAPRGLRGYFFNLSSDKFSDVRVREALSLLYDFEAIQRTVLYGKYSRAEHYFNGAGYSSTAKPEGKELEVLETYRDQLPKDLFNKPYGIPKTNGSGRDRVNKRKALGLLKSAGWSLNAGKMTNEKGEQFQLEIITGRPETEIYTASYIETLKKLGIDASLRIVDSAQWRARSRDKDFDLLAAATTFQVPPGGELKSYYHSKVAGGNMAGASHPVIDALIDQVALEKDSETHYAIMHALDRVILWDYHAVPLYYRPNAWVAHWDKFAHPEKSPKYAIGISSTWWFDPDKQ